MSPSLTPKLELFLYRPKFNSWVMLVDGRLICLPPVGIFRPIAILTVTSPIAINVPTRGLLAVETKDSFVLWLAKFKCQKTCL